MSFLRIGDMTWPDPETNLGWKLRYAPESVNRSDQLTLAAIVDAYQELTMNKTTERRNAVVKQIRTALRSRFKTDTTVPQPASMPSQSHETAAS